MEFSKNNWVTISETICPEMLIFGKWASWTWFFQNILTNPIISEISFLCRHTLVLYTHAVRELFYLRFPTNSYHLSTVELAFKVVLFTRLGSEGPVKTIWSV